MCTHGLVLIGQVALARLPYLFREVEDSPAFRPSGVKRRVGDDRGDLFLRDAVRLRVLEMELEGRIGDALRHERDDRDDAARLYVDILIVPVLAEENIVIVMCKLRGELAECISACRLYYFRHCY